jgi:hypothetical protein
MSRTVTNTLSELPFEARLQWYFAMLEEILAGRDVTLAALREQADLDNVRLIIVGGVAVARHGRHRSTTDRDVLVSYRNVNLLADRLMDHPDWERLEIRQYAFLHRPTAMPVDFLVSRDLMQWGRPYYFPELDEVETTAPVADIPVIGLHDLLWMKLMAWRPRDYADAAELCMLHFGEIDPERVLKHLEPEDNDIRERFLDVLKQVPMQIEKERRFNQGLGRADVREDRDESGPSDKPPHQP